MCGIAGLVGRLSDSNRQALSRMNRAILHRGPDSEGSWESTTNNRGWGTMLTHRRLSILDLSPAGAQPMIDRATGHVVIFNGEIYNYADVRDRLGEAGRDIRSTGDTEVLLRALSVRGVSAISEMRGMFAFAFWDSTRRKLVMARDPLGIKPLYFTRNTDPNGEWSLIFASEIRAILNSGLIENPKLNSRTVASLVWNGFTVAPETAIAGIESVLPGEYRVFDEFGTEEQAEIFWDTSSSRNAQAINEEELTQALEESVRLHLTSDVPVGVFLSSGVDSTAVANLAQRASVTPINTFTMAFEEAEYNEAVISRQIAKAIGTNHQEIVLTEQRFTGELDAALDSLDQPSFDGVNSYFIARSVREAGFKVALAGTGGDELFGGYTSFRDLPALHSWSKRTSWLPRNALVGLARLAASILQPQRGAVAQQTRWAKLPDMVRHGDDLLSLYQLAYALFLPEFQQQLLGKHALAVDGLPAPTRQRLVQETRGRSALSALSIFEERIFLGERLLRDTDATSMAVSLEVRLPLVDQVLFETVDRLGENARYQPLGRKEMLRRIGLRGLDPALFNRPKSGFVLPYDRWLKTGMRKSVDALLCDPVLVAPTGLNPEAVRRLWEAYLAGAPGLYWSRIWVIYMLVWWCHRHKVYAAS